MAKRSAGVLLHRRRGAAIEVLLVHPGGPYWRNKDAGAWQIPKGQVEEHEDHAEAARREVEEELGLVLQAELEFLATIRQAGGKIVEAFTIEAEFDPDGLISNRFEMEWPPRSGKAVAFPEVDAARWMSFEEAEAFMLESQKPLLAALQAKLSGR